MNFDFPCFWILKIRYLFPKFEFSMYVNLCQFMSDLLFFDVLKFPIFEIFQKSKLKGTPIRAHVFSSACSNKLADSTQSWWQRGHERLEIEKIYNYFIFSKLIQSLRRWRISLVIKIARPHTIVFQLNFEQSCTRTSSR